MRISDWSSDVCSSGLGGPQHLRQDALLRLAPSRLPHRAEFVELDGVAVEIEQREAPGAALDLLAVAVFHDHARPGLAGPPDAALGHHCPRVRRVSGVVHPDAARAAAPGAPPPTTSLVVAAWGDNELRSTPSPPHRA